MRALLATLLVLTSTAGAVAQSCGALRAQLAAAESGSGGGAEVSRLRRTADAYGCTSSAGFGRNPACASIELQLRRASGAADPRTVRRLRAQVANACGGAQEVREAPIRSNRAASNAAVRAGVPQAEEAPRGFFARLFGQREDRQEVVVVSTDPAAATSTDGVERVGVDGSSRTRKERAPGTVETLATASGRQTVLREGSSRTVCVRLCDGFYFPINSRSHSDNFYEELAMCVGRCPGADVSLYVHHAEAAVESMRSTMTGEPYTSLPTAFAYRKALVPSCGCQRQTTVAGQLDAERTLSYANLDTGTALDAAELAAGDGRWTPFRAVYDGTGQPLDLSLGSRRQPTRAPASVATAPAPTAAPTTAVPAGRVRAVGDEFFSEVTSAPVSQNRLLRLPNLGTGAVSVVPVAPTAVVVGPAPRSQEP